MTLAAARSQSTDPLRLREQTLDLARAMADAGKRLALALEEKERLSRLLDAVLENLDAGVALCTAEGKVLAANRAATHLGVVSDGVDGRRRLHPAVAAHAPEDPAPMHPQGVNGPAWIVRTRPIDFSGSSDATLAVVTDVTALVDLERRERRRSRFEAAGRMAAELAHEVRNPLGSLELFASMLHDDLEDRPAQRDMAEEVLKGVRRLSSTVTRLLSAVRGSGMRRGRCDLAALAREGMQFVAPIAQARQIVLTAPAAHESLLVQADAEALHQALLNLLGNALDVTPAGGRIDVRVHDGGQEVALEVHDSGPGVPLTLRERIFEPLFTTRDGGTGLGLAVVERVAMDHGGRADASDSPLGGALLRLRFPRQHENPKESSD